jgi:hypothetical protein
MAMNNQESAIVEGKGWKTGELTGSDSRSVGSRNGPQTVVHDLGALTITRDDNFG